jgi:predicted dehydrogenase
MNGTAYGAIREELAYFCECVRAVRKPEVITPEAGRDAVKVALALIESAQTGRDIEL